MSRDSLVVLVPHASSSPVRSVPAAVLQNHVLDGTKWKVVTQATCTIYFRFVWKVDSSGGPTPTLPPCSYFGAFLPRLPREWGKQRSLVNNKMDHYASAPAAADFTNHPMMLTDSCSVLISLASTGENSSLHNNLSTNTLYKINIYIYGIKKK